MDAYGIVLHPPAEHRLSDALVFPIIRHNVIVKRNRNRHGKWPADFNSDGDIYPGRWPMGEPVILWAFGLPWIAVYSDYYILAGSRLRN